MISADQPSATWCYYFYPHFTCLPEGPRSSNLVFPIPSHYLVLPSLNLVYRVVFFSGPVPFDQEDADRPAVELVLDPIDAVGDVADGAATPLQVSVAFCLLTFRASRLESCLLFWNIWSRQSSQVARCVRFRYVVLAAIHRWRWCSILQFTCETEIASTHLSNGLLDRCGRMKSWKKNHETDSATLQTAEGSVAAIDEDLRSGRLLAQFDLLPRCRPELSTQVARRDENLRKNRYGDIFPCETFLKVIIIRGCSRLYLSPPLVLPSLISHHNCQRSETERFYVPVMIMLLPLLSLLLHISVYLCCLARDQRWKGFVFGA